MGQLSSFSERIEAGMWALNLKQADVARKAGVSDQTVSQVKSGVASSQHVVEIFCEMLGCTAEWLTAGTGEAPTWAASPDAFRQRQRNRTATRRRPPTGNFRRDSLAIIDRMQLELDELRRRLNDDDDSGGATLPERPPEREERALGDAVERARRVADAEDLNTDQGTG